MDMLKRLCDGPGCKNMHEMPLVEATTRSAPSGWVSATVDIAAPTNDVMDGKVDGDFCSDACLTAAIAAERAKWVSGGGTGAEK